MTELKLYYIVEELAPYEAKYVAGPFAGWNEASDARAKLDKSWKYNIRIQTIEVN